MDAPRIAGPDVAGTTACVGTAVGAIGRTVAVGATLVDIAMGTVVGCATPDDEANILGAKSAQLQRSSVPPMSQGQRRRFFLSGWDG
jgi:hypothetical protein